MLCIACFVEILILLLFESVKSINGGFLLLILSPILFVKYELFISYSRSVAMFGLHSIQNILKF